MYHTTFKSPFFSSALEPAQHKWSSKTAIQLNDPQARHESKNEGKFERQRW